MKIKICTKKNHLFGFAMMIAFWLSCISVYAQSITKVSGKVTDVSGMPLPGVSVKEKDSKNGTQTDPNGHYVINVSSENATLVFSYLGYIVQEKNVAGSTTVNVIMEEDVKSLNEVVVVGYGTQKRSDVTGSVVSIPKDRLEKLPVTNVLSAVEGSVAGVTVSTGSSVPGRTPSVLVRGQNSITAGNGPYIVVDGIPLSKSGGGINDINPNDIASIEVLKDASAVAIYGTNGANGVILITTKRGTSGKPIIKYNGYTGLENMAHLLTPRSAASYIQKYADYLQQTGQTQTSPVPNYSELANYQSGITTDWIKEATQQGIIQDHNVNISGGSDAIKYYISGDYLNQKGVVKGYQYKRASLRYNLDAKITDFLSIGTTLFYTNNNYDGGTTNLLLATAMSPYGQEYNTDGTYNIYPMYPELLYQNPLLGLYQDHENRSSNLNANGYAELKFGGILKGLKYRFNAGYTYLPTRYGTYTGRNANNTLGYAQVGSSETNSYTIENILTYAKDWNKNHIDFTGLYSAQQRKYNNQDASATGFVNDLLSFHELSAGATQTSNSYADQYNQLSQMGRLNYTYDGKYLATITVRRDGSSVFGSSTNKYGVFPSFALGWNISQEKFLKNVGWISSLKLRGSYGKSGNEAIGVYGTITTDGTNRYPFNGISTIGVLAGNLGNTNLHWETTKGTNLGLDFSLFKDRLSGSLDLYKTNTEGLILRRNLPIITGYSNVLDNLGQTKNKGIELMLTSRNITHSAFKWETSINFATNKNEIVDLYGDKKSDLGNRWFIGSPINVIYDYKMTGVWQVGEDPSTQDPGAKPGYLKFADLNGDGKITADDKMILGQRDPKWTGGITNTFHYNNFSLNIFIQTAQGMMKNNADMSYADETGRRNTPTNIGYWTEQNKSNTRPSLAYFNTKGYGYPMNASYTRIKDVTFSYVFSKNLIDKLKLGGLTMYLSGRNLYTFTKWVGWDPENNYSTRGSGDWTNNYPTVRSIIFGANISLR